MPKVGRLKELRERRVLTQQDLADKAHVAKSTIVQLERSQAEGRPTTIRKLAEALGVAPEELVGE